MPNLSDTTCCTAQFDRSAVEGVERAVDLEVSGDRRLRRHGGSVHRHHDIDSRLPFVADDDVPRADFIRSKGSIEDASVRHAVDREPDIAALLHQRTGGEQQPRLLLSRCMGSGGVSPGQAGDQRLSVIPRRTRFRSQRDQRSSVAKQRAKVPPIVAIGCVSRGESLPEDFFRSRPISQHRQCRSELCLCERRGETVKARIRVIADLANRRPAVPGRT